MPAFNKNHLANLVKQEADVKEALQGCTAKLNDLYESDGWDDAKRAKYNDENIRHAQLTRDYNLIKNEREAYALFEPEAAKAKMDSPFVRFLRNGRDGLESWEVEQYTKTDLREAKNKDCFVVKGSTKSDDASGVNITDPSVRPNVLEVLKQYGGISQMAYNFTTSNGAGLSIPQQDDASEKGAALPQGGPTTEQNLGDFGSVTFGARTLTSKRIRITREMVDDGIIDVETYTQNKALRRMGRGWDERLTLISTTAPATLGARNAAPPVNEVPGDVEVSLERAASVGNTTAKAGMVTYDDLVNLIYTVDPAYRDGMEMGENGENAEMGGRVGFIISDAAERAIRLLTDGEKGRPLWQPRNDGIASLGVAGSGMLLGYPYVRSNVLNGGLAVNSEKDVFFGNFSYYGIRTVNSFEVFNFWDSSTAENNEIEVVGFSRRYGRNMYDGALPGAGKRWAGMPMIKVLKMGSSL